MILLPIVVREFRVASRRSSTFRVRWITAAAAALLAFAVMAFTDARSRTAGPFLFSGLTAGAFLFAVYCGPFLAAESISEEKRDGTLGLLFLTDLGGVDIVTGKLLVTGLAAVLALLSVFPVMGLSWILGGVTGAEVWRTALALLQTLMLSMTVSLAVSAARRRPAGSIAWSAALMTVLVFGAGLLFSLVMAGAPGAPGTPAVIRWLLGCSPWVAFQSASDAVYRTDPAVYWRALACGQACVWVAVGVATVLTSRRWQESGEPDRGYRRSGPARIRRVPPGSNPVLALGPERMPLRAGLWLLAATGGVGVVANLAAGGSPLLPYSLLPMAGGAGGSSLMSMLETGLMFLMKVLFAWQACEFWSHGRRTGELEILLSTPVRDDQILDAHWSHLRRTFLGPVLLLMAFLALGTAAHALMGAAASPSDAIAAWGLWMYQAVTLPLEFLALAWMGAWQGLTAGRPGGAFGRTVLLVLVLPALFFCLPAFLVAGLWFGYARRRMSQPLRSILQGDWHRRGWRLGRATPDPEALYGGTPGRGR